MSDPSGLPADCDISHLWDYLTDENKEYPLSDTSLEDVMKLLGLSAAELESMCRKELF